MKLLCFIICIVLGEAIFSQKTNYTVYKLHVKKIQKTKGELKEAESGNKQPIKTELISEFLRYTIEDSSFIFYYDTLVRSYMRYHLPNKKFFETPMENTIIWKNKTNFLGYHKQSRILYSYNNDSYSKINITSDDTIIQWNLSSTMGTLLNGRIKIVKSSNPNIVMPPFSFAIPYLSIEKIISPKLEIIFNEILILNKISYLNELNLIKQNLLSTINKNVEEFNFKNFFLFSKNEMFSKHK